jgi:uncharacterized DUF497 family protein
MRIPSLRWTEWNEEHIACHGVEPSEVDEIVVADEFHMVRVRAGRYALIGQTNAGRYLSIIVERESDGGFFVVTARPADSSERRLHARHRR